MVTREHTFHQNLDEFSDFDSQQKEETTEPVETLKEFEVQNCE